LALSDSMIASWEAKQEELTVIEAGRNPHDMKKDEHFDDEESNSTTSNSAIDDIESSSNITESSVDSSNEDQHDARKQRSRCLHALPQRFVMLKDKVFDIHERTQAPPGMQSDDCIWVFLGSFLTLISISYVSEYIPLRSSIPLPPLGAFVTLLYGLTSAPATQPRNAIYGCTISGCIALALSYIPMDLVNLRISLAASLSISLMAFLGVTHPPAGALAVFLSMNNQHGWITLLLYLLGALIAIAIAMVVNNLNEKRMYPLYWRLVPTACCQKNKH